MTEKMSFVGHDREVVTGLVNQGIDARLEAFTGGSFRDNGHRLSCEIPDEQVPILVRRLSEFVERNPEDEEAERLLDDVVAVFFMEEYEGC